MPVVARLHRPRLRRLYLIVEARFVASVAAFSEQKKKEIKRERERKEKVRAPPSRSAQQTAAIIRSELGAASDSRDGKRSVR